MSGERAKKHQTGSQTGARNPPASLRRGGSLGAAVEGLNPFGEGTGMWLVWLRLVTATQLLGSQSPMAAVQIRFCLFRRG